MAAERLTRDDILNMKAGPETDALVAEYMGMPPARCVGVHYVSRDMALDAGDPSLEGSVYGEEWEAVEPPPFSTSYAASRAAMVHLAATHWWELKSPFYPGAPWWLGATPHNCTGWNGRPDNQVAFADMDELPLAVCKVFLLTKLDAGEAAT